MSEQPVPAISTSGRGGLGLRADWANRFGLCCVALVFAAFAIDKGAGQPCPNLQTDFGAGPRTAGAPTSSVRSFGAPTSTAPA
ncbi:hypothetical protein GCM10010446_22160 [Streptomyces enissocaesilis]|uniref:Uncharacterized protein n=1 Tax=Streptomyces enissocaesilis TaxID=332589 RepID=A0ABN3X638_9ACTN